MPLIVIAAITERKAFAKVRIVIPLLRMRLHPAGRKWCGAQNYSIAKFVICVAFLATVQVTIHQMFGGGSYFRAAKNATARKTPTKYAFASL